MDYILKELERIQQEQEENVKWNKERINELRRKNLDFDTPEFNEANRKLDRENDRLEQTNRLIRELSFNSTTIGSVDQMYDKNLLEFVTNNLDKKLSEEVYKCIRKDRNRTRDSQKIKLQKEKDKLINSILSVGKNTIPSFYEKSKKRELSKINDAIENGNKAIYSKVINWLEDKYVDYFLNMWYQNTDKISDGKNYYAQNIDIREVDEVQKQSIIKKCDELLKLNLSLEEIEKTKKYKECTIEKYRIDSIMTAIDEVLNSMNKDYIATRKKLLEIKKKFWKELHESKKYQRDYYELENYINNLMAKKIKEKKFSTEKEVNKVERKVEEKPPIKTVVDKHNEQWEQRFLINYIERKRNAKLGINCLMDSAYSQDKFEANESLNKYKKELNNTLQEYFVKYLEKELASFILANYQPNSKNEEENLDINFIIRDATMSPEERYIRDMVEAGKKPKATTIDNLTSEDYKNIKKHSDRYFDDAYDKKVKEIREKIDEVKNTNYFEMYEIEVVEEMIKDIKKENNTYEVASKRLGPVL